VTHKVVKEETRDDKIFVARIQDLKCKCIFADGRQEEAPLRAGDFGFLVATFSFGEHTTDLANLLLLPPVKKKPAKAVCKKPASAPVNDGETEVDSDSSEAEESANEEEEEPSEEDRPPAPAPKPASAPEKAVTKYRIEWYKNGHNIGLRENFGGKRQIVSFGGKACTKSEQDLKAIAKDIVKMLNEGSSPAVCKAEGNRRAFL